MSKRIAKTERLAMARRFDQAGATKSDFCRAEKISASTLDYWREQLRRHDAQAIEGQFIEVVVEQGRATSESAVVQCQVEVELPFGVKLRFYGASAGR